MGYTFLTHTESKKDIPVEFLDTPDTCPICHVGIDPRILFAYLDQARAIEAQVLFQCPLEKCRKLFIGYYQRSINIDSYSLRQLKPITVKPPQFSKEVRSISKTFIEIYSEAFTAEIYDLMQICGAGYRKSLEFLVKDYTIRQTTDDHEIEDIKTSWLAKVIEKYISNENIKFVAERATWLGNDESHYVRKWTEMDIKDLKRLIELTVKWIEMEEMTRAYKAKMTNEL